MKKIINVAPWSLGEWKWFQGKTAALAEAEWQFFGPLPYRWFERFFMTERLSRLRACWQAARAFRKGKSDVLVAHGPLYAVWAAFFMGKKPERGQFIVISFNYTDLPNERMTRFMSRQFQKIDRFVTYSTLEIELYARVFGIPAEKIDMIHWGVNPPVVPDPKPFVAGDYVAAIGGEGRDYHTLVAAARLMPATRFVLVAREKNLVGLELPPNVTSFTNLALPDAMNVLKHAMLAVVPLLTSRTPCGHVTIVAGMHLGKAQVVTQSQGVADYIIEGETGLYAKVGDPVDLSRQIGRLLEDPALRLGIAEKAGAFAREHCVEAAAVRYFESWLATLPQSN